MEVKVAKFGGTSMGGGGAIRQVADILTEGEGQKVAVVSAVSGTTDRLIELCELALNKEALDGKLRELEEKHEEILKELEVELDLQMFFTELKNILQGVNLLGELSLSVKDKVIGFGERISSNILAEFLKNKGINSQAISAFDLIFTNNNFGEGKVDFEKSNAAIKNVVGELLNERIFPVITGFIAQSESGDYITLGRGGSDYSAAIIAAALEAKELQIWTDVDGILNTDPRIVSEASVLPQLSFNEASELAYFGAKVLHPKTIKPAVSKNIPVKILNTFNVSAPGTIITNEETESVKSVTYKKGISVINICSAGMLESHGFMARIFEVFAWHDVVVDVVSTSEVSVSVTVENGDAEKVYEDLSKFAKVEITEKMAICCLVGEGIRAGKGVLGELFSCLDEHNLAMVSVGASKRNVTFLVKEDEAPDVIQKVFNQFFK